VIIAFETVYYIQYKEESFVLIQCVITRLRINREQGRLVRNND
jgi:hypothetical protein